jgi:hypothetical protein
VAGSSSPLARDLWPLLPSDTGRTGGNRTPNPRFWRPVLCQLSYCPQYIRYIARGPLPGERLRATAAPSSAPHSDTAAAPVLHQRPAARGQSQAAVSPRPLLGLLMSGMLPAKPAVLAQLEALGRLLPVLRRAVVAALAGAARHRDDVSHVHFALGPHPRRPSRLAPSLAADAATTARSVRRVEGLRA